MEPVIWGVIGAANIARNKVAPGMMRSRQLKIAAVAARDPARARDMAKTLGIPDVCATYEELLARPDIEAIYNPLPNPWHVPWTLRAMEAGKHVLCEKPIAMDAAEAGKLIEARERTGKLVAEAFMVRQHPQWRRAREIVRSDEIGEPRVVQVAFAYRNVDPANIRNRKDTGGGAVYDIGCYAIVAGRYFFAAEPERVAASLDRDPAFGTDRLAAAIVEFSGGRRLVFTCSTQIAPYQRIDVLGVKGRLTIQTPFNADPKLPTRIVVDDARDIYRSGARSETLPPCDQYQLQGEEFSRAVRGLQPLEFPIEDAIANMRVIDALFRSEASGGWASV